MWDAASRQPCEDTWEARHDPPQTSTYQHTHGCWKRKSDGSPAVSSTRGGEALDAQTPSALSGCAQPAAEDAVASTTAKTAVKSCILRRGLVSGQAVAQSREAGLNAAAGICRPEI